MNTQPTSLKNFDQPNWEMRSRTANVPAERPELVKELTEVIYELRDLLEEYAPSWYSLEHHTRVESALQRVSRH
ncbi:MAG TPA: hypothetical protein VKV39_00265 [Candidatus Sulfotelmatobacter sp.]|nr:hypothetical protein [Candidatus Sulfotelmatobacter sp.]